LRPDALQRCLAALARQTEPPDEVVVSDAGLDPKTSQVTESFRPARAWSVRYCPTDRAALPWQRWWGFLNSRCSIVVFVDDDVQLMPEAIALLRQTYREDPTIAGAGFAISYGDCEAATAATPTLREQWLGIAGERPGTISRGGITVDLPMPDDRCGRLDVEWLSGGAMSFRRDVLTAIGPQDRLFELYDAHIGKAEDAILSSRARQHGRLMLIAGRHARHPPFDQATRTANPQDGYLKGLLETWGRAHVLRWLGRNPSTAFRTWLRLASLELLRAGRAILQQPSAGSRWLRIIGALVGIQRALLRWNRIPGSPCSTGGSCGY
jgi:GT2 family glycosyltransferase